MSRAWAILFAVAFGLNMLFGVGRGGVPLCLGHDDHEHPGHVHADQCDGAVAAARMPAAPERAHPHHPCDGAPTHIHITGLDCAECDTHLHLFAAPTVLVLEKPRAAAGLLAPFEQTSLPTFVEPTAPPRDRSPFASAREHPRASQRLAVVESTRLII